MKHDRINDLGEDIRNHVFEMLDAEPETDGDQCGRVAKAVEEAFIQAMHKDEPIGNDGDIRCPACGWVDAPNNGRCYECGAAL